MIPSDYEEDVDPALEEARKRLVWKEGRYHLDGKPMHAGDAMKMLTDHFGWIFGRIETESRGQDLYFHFWLNEVRVETWKEPRTEVRVSLATLDGGVWWVAGRLQWP